MIVTCSDYYEPQVGYVFTDCNNGIHALIIDGKDSGAINDFYLNESFV